MNKPELVSSIVEKTGLKKKDAEKAVDAFIDTVVDAVAQGDKVQLVGFGVFKYNERSERTGGNPQTNEEIVIPASKQPVFKAGKAFKEAVCGISSNTSEE